MAHKIVSLSLVMGALLARCANAVPVPVNDLVITGAAIHDVFGILALLVVGGSVLLVLSFLLLGLEAALDVTEPGTHLGYEEV
ncbi:hypothetical protein F5B20DRAFT_563974 [Whalleya microplaca]|nr:hypothetical protein F5B20DRAFT_563974 [Whalleya microplaca]